MKKKYNISKLLLIFFLFAIPIYILYFNESENSKSILNLNETLKESYTNYVNICKNGEIPEFYNISATSLLKTIPLDGSGCNYYCDQPDNSLCDFFTIDDRDEVDKCKLYSYSGDSATKVHVNCASKYQNGLTSELNTIASSERGFDYNGKGFVKSKFYHTDGSNAFTYNDVILEKANDIRDEMIDIQYLLNNRPDDDSIERKHLLIENTKASLAKYLDISMGNLFSTLSIGLNTFNKDAKTMKFDPKKQVN